MLRWVLTTQKTWSLLWHILLIEKVTRECCDEDMWTPLSNHENMPLIDSCFPAIDKVRKVSNRIQKNQIHFKKTLLIELCQKKESCLDFGQRSFVRCRDP